MAVHGELYRWGTTLLLVCWVVGGGSLARMEVYIMVISLDFYARGPILWLPLFQKFGICDFRYFSISWLKFDFHIQWTPPAAQE